MARSPGFGSKELHWGVDSRSLPLLRLSWAPPSSRTAASAQFLYSRAHYAKGTNAPDPSTPDRVRGKGRYWARLLATVHFSVCFHFVGFQPKVFQRSLTVLVHYRLRYPILGFEDGTSPPAWDDPGPKARRLRPAGRGALRTAFAWHRPTSLPRFLDVLPWLRDFHPLRQRIPTLSRG